MKKILLCLGTRPEVIKLAPLEKALAAYKDRMDTVLCVTGQHHEMLQSALNSFGLKPKYNLAVMEPGQSLGTMTAKILERLMPVLAKEKPDAVVVQGDTTSAYTAALAAFYAGIPVAHVEAGLRSGSLQEPWPEEFNRQSIGRLARWHFAPTETARQNLKKENVPEESIFVTGNTAIDALQMNVRTDYTSEILDWAEGSRLLILTAHRRENLGDGLAGIFRALVRVLAERENVKLLYPMHLNPLVREKARKLEGTERLRALEPMEASAFQNTLARCHFVLTDSGGIQEEASALHKPVLVLRNRTERPEGVETGALRLVGCEEAAVYAACLELLDDEELYRRMTQAENPYGDGHAAEKIARLLAEELL